MSSDAKQTFKIAYSINEACEATSLKRTTMYELIKNGDVQATRIGKRTLVTAASLHALVLGKTHRSTSANDPPT